MRPINNLRFASQTSIGLGLIGIAGSFLSFLGWALDVPRLADWDADGIAMQPNTALAGMLAGAAVISLALGLRRVHTALGLGVLFIGGATALEHATGRSFGIDGLLLFGRSWGSAVTVSPGRMGPPASISFVLLGLAFLLAMAREGARARAAAPWVALVVVCMALLATAGYLLGANPLYMLPRMTGIALQTAGILIALGLGVASALPRQEPMRTILEDGGGGVLARRTLPFIISLPIILGWIRVIGQEEGLYDTGMGTAILAVLLIVLLCAVLAAAVSAVRAWEAVLQARERELSDFFENASVGMHWLGPDGIILRANRADMELLGYRPEEYIGRHIAEFHADPQVIADLLQRLQAGEQVRDYPAQLRCKDGSVKDVLIASSVKWKEGKFLHTRSFTLDVTDRKQAEAALRESERRFKSLTSHAPVGIFQTDAEGNCLFVNHRWCEMAGMTLEQARGKGWMGALHPLDRERIERQWYQAAGDGLEFSSEYRFLTSQGEVTWLSGSAVAMRNESGKVQGYIGTVTDITDRKAAEEIAARLLEELRLVTDSLPALISYVDAEGRYRFNNKGYSEWFGRTPEDIQGKHLREVLGESAYERVRPYVESALCGQRVHYDQEIPYREGGTRFVHAEYVPDVRADGSVAGFYALVTDTTAARQAEQALRDADRRKDEFLATLAHELRNPLAPMRNSLELMKRAPGDAEVLEQARSMMERQMTQMVRLIDDLLDVSRITRDKLVLRKQRIELASTIHHAVETCRPLADAARHDLAVELPAEPLYLDADPIRLTQVFGNLLGNACKYSERGGRIRLTAQREGSDVVVSVKDGGIGIPAHLLPTIFEMFAQVDQSLEKSQGGLGIGLTLAKRLVELHDGSLTAHSDGPGQGSEFVVRLPLILEPSSASRVETPAEVVSGSRRKILVVDDNRDSALSLATLLKISGNETQVAHDGAAAVETAEALRPDVILLDIGMPKLNGYDACRAIRAKPWGRNILIVALTGWGQEEDRRKSNEVGFNKHLVKPVDLAALMRILAGE